MTCCKAGYSSVGVGSATAWGRHLDEVQHTLEEIERLHQQLKNGGVNKALYPAAANVVPAFGYTVADAARLLSLKTNDR